MIGFLPMFLIFMALFEAFAFLFGLVPANTTILATFMNGGAVTIINFLMGILSSSLLVGAATGIVVGLIFRNLEFAFRTAIYTSILFPFLRDYTLVWAVVANAYGVLFTSIIFIPISILLLNSLYEFITGRD